MLGKKWLKTIPGRCIFSGPDLVCLLVIVEQQLTDLIIVRSKSIRHLPLVTIGGKTFWSNLNENKFVRGCEMVTLRRTNTNNIDAFSGH
jgi:hypothetical protein